MLQNKNSASVKENYLFNGTDLNIKVNINQKDFLEKKEGDIIYQKGETADFVYLIIEGEIKLKISGVFSSPVVVKSGKNEFFGEKELLENTKRTSSAVANTDCLLYRLDRATLNSFIQQNKLIKKNLFKSLQFDDLEEPESFEGQKEFFIKPEGSPEKFTFIKKEEEKKETETVNQAEEIKQSNSGLNISESAGKASSEKEKGTPYHQVEKPEKELNWDFTSAVKEPEFPEVPAKDEITGKENESYIETKNENGEKEFSIGGNIELIKRFTGLIDSDTKYPVLTLKFYAEQIKKKEMSKEINEVVDLLIEQANIISDAIEAAHNFAENKISLNFQPVSINAALDEILGILADYVESKNSRLYKKYETTALVNLDVRQFYQAVFQIMKNACEAMPGGGNVYVVSKTEGGNVKIEIKNTGESIPRGLHGKIFEPFFSYGKDKAAGLGLSIADSIIKGHSGSIMIDSESEETRFIISIPFVE